MAAQKTPAALAERFSTPPRAEDPQPSRRRRQPRVAAVAPIREIDTGFERLTPPAGGRGAPRNRRNPAGRADACVAAGPGDSARAGRGGGRPRRSSGGCLRGRSGRCNRPTRSVDFCSPSGFSRGSATPSSPGLTTPRSTGGFSFCRGFAGPLAAPLVFPLRSPSRIA